VAVVRILGVDPGTLVVGYACLETECGRVLPPTVGVPLAMRASNVVRVGGQAGAATRLLAAGVLRLGGRDTLLPQRLLHLSDRMRELFAAWAPDELAIEEAFHGKSAQAALRIGEARGVVIAEAARGGVAVHQFAPARVKRCVAGNGAASKLAVAAMVRQLLPAARGVLPAALPLDATDAIAVAWTRLEERQSPLVQLRELGGPP
jgi:crossover junction endodeoxyribonuclease RuvC